MAIKIDNITSCELKDIKRDIIATKTLLLELFKGLGELWNITGANLFNGSSSFVPLYVNATEDMRSYYKIFSSPKTFLTIGGSGEQVVNAINCGANDIDVFDSNYLAKYAVSLRLAAICGLSKEEFISYYTSFNKELFDKFKDYLDEAAYIFWNDLYDTYSEEMAPDIFKTLLFRFGRIEESLHNYINPYLDDDKYELLKDKIDQCKINYIDCDLYTLPSFIKDRKYDGMTFSNIYEYINYDSTLTKAKAIKYRNFIMYQILPHLNNDGAIMISYLYAFNMRLKKEFDALYKKYPKNIVASGPITNNQYYFYKMGLTYQNLAYSLLLDAFKNDNVKKIPTTHVLYGHSIEMDHDLALCLKK